MGFGQTLAFALAFLTLGGSDSSVVLAQNSFSVSGWAPASTPASSSFGYLPSPTPSPSGFVPPSDSVSGSVNKTQYTRFTVEMDGTGPVQIHQFIVDFNFDIFIRLPNGTVRPFGNFLKLDTDEQLLLSNVGAGTVTLNCDGDVIPDANTSPYGLPNSYLTAPPTFSPASNLLTYLFKGRILNTTANVPNPKRWAAGFGLTSQRTWPWCDVTFRTSSASGYLISDSLGRPLNNTLRLNFSAPACDYSGVLDLNDAAVTVINGSDTVNGFNELFQLSNLIASVRARESFEGCSNLISGFMTYRTQNFTTPPSDSCDVPYDDPQWGRDPCCNSTLLATQCCLPSVSIVPVKVIQNYSTTDIAAKCRSGDQITALIADFVAAQQNAGTEKLNLDQMFKSQSAFIGKCNQDVFDTKCKNNGDCPFHSGCDKRAGRCIVDYDDPTDSILACYATRMSPEVKLSLKDMLDLPPVSNSLKEETQILLDKLRPLVSSTDCVGSTSYQYRKSIEWVLDETGNYVTKETPTNVTGCLSDLSCSLNPWERTNRDLCLRDPSQTGFCAQCEGSYCFPVSEFTACKSYALNKQYCESINGTFIPDPYIQGPVTSSSIGECEFYGIQNQTACITGAPACIPGNNDYCTSNICVNNNYNTETPCVNANYIWDSTRQQCVSYDKNVNECRNLANHQFFAGRVFTPGTLETQQSCAIGACDQYDLRAKKVDPQTCKNSQYCTFQCPACVSLNALGGGCSAPSITDPSVCAGTPDGYFDSTINVCTIAVNRTVCLQRNYKWSSCSTLNVTSCDATSSLDATIGQCYWDTWAPCTSKETCLAAGGQCNDWEFGNGGSNGACVYKPAELFNCDENDWSTQAGECIDTEANAKAACDQKGSRYRWVTRAKTEAECLSRANQCILPQGDIALYNATYCKTCGGDLRSVYSWIDAEWVNATVINTTWVPLTWNSTNKIKSTLDFEKLRRFSEGAIARTIARELVANFNQKTTQYISIFKAIACDCTPGSASRSCFSDIITAPLRSCLSNPNSNATCGDVISIPGGFSSSNDSASIDISFVAPASFFGPPDNTTAPARKKRAVSTKNPYAIVKFRSTVVGQLIGSGKKLTLGSKSKANVTICLERDFNIPQDNATYRILDFVNGTASALGEPLRANVSIRGKFYCGSVPSFSSAMFFPILRNELVISSSSSVSATSPSTFTTSVSSFTTTVPVSTPVPSNTATSATRTTSAGGVNTGNGSGVTTTTATTTSTAGAASSRPATTSGAVPSKPTLSGTLVTAIMVVLVSLLMF